MVVQGRRITGIEDLTRFCGKEAETEMAIATENLYLGAYALVNGARLERISLSRANGRTTAVFELDCAWAQKLSDEYYAGTAVVNLAEYREKLERLKDELFAALKQTETERSGHEGRRRPRRSGF